MDLDRYLTALRRGWVWIVVLTVGMGLTGFVWAVNQPPVYRATAAVFFQVEGAENPQALLQGSTYTQNQVRSYAELARTEVVLDPVIEQLGLDRSAASLAGSITVNVPLDTAIVEVSASDGSPEQAQALANAVADQLGTSVEQLSQGSSTSESAIKVTAQTVQQASLPSVPVSPKPMRDAIMAAALGFIIGVLVALGREYFNNKVTDEDSLMRVTADLPLLGQIPWAGSRKTPSQLLTTKDHTQVESVRRCAANFEFVNHSGAVRAVVITSSQPGEGKSTMAASLALALSSSRRVLLIDADLRKPTLAQRLGLEPAVGLTSIITGKATLAEAVQHVGRNPNLSVVTSGVIPPNPLALLGSEAFAALISEARKDYDAVIIDAPPLLPVADAAIISRVADGAILVVASRKSTNKQIARAARYLSLAEVPVHGAILTMVKGRTGESGYYGQEAPKPAGPSGSLPKKLTSKSVALSGARR